VDTRRADGDDDAPSPLSPTLPLVEAIAAAQQDRAAARMGDGGALVAARRSAATVAAAAAVVVGPHACRAALAAAADAAARCHNSKAGLRAMVYRRTSVAVAELTRLHGPHAKRK